MLASSTHHHASRLKMWLLDENHSDPIIEFCLMVFSNQISRQDVDMDLSEIRIRDLADVH